MMVATRIETIVDGDGHIYEDDEAIVRFLPARYAHMYRGGPVFPKTDHLHIVMGATPPDSFRRVAADGWLEFLKDLGLKATVLYPSGGLTYGRIVNRDWAIAVTRAYNDWLYETYLRAGPEFKGMALIPLQEPGAAVEELRHAVRDLGMVGAMLPATGLSVPLGEKQFWPVYEEAERLGCCLGIHGGAHIGMGLDHFNVYPGVHALGHPFSILINFGSIILNGVFDKYPGLRVGFMEAGTGWVPWIANRLDKEYIERRREVPLLQERPSEYMRRFFYGTQPIEEPQNRTDVVKLFELFDGENTAMFASDWPHHDFDHTQFVFGLPFSPEARRKIMGLNATRFFKLDPSP